MLGLGNIGPGAALPVMEGKAALFKRFANIDAWPICLASQDTDEIVKAVEMIAPGFGGINLEDIAAPRCFEIEARLRASLDIPVFHDDQHGTAIVVMAALTNALRVVGKKMRGRARRRRRRGRRGLGDRHADARRGHHGHRGLGPRGLPVLRRHDAAARQGRAWPRAPTPARSVATLHDGLRGADVFVGVSAPNVLDPQWIKDMAPDAVVFALANPDPEVDPAEADKYAAVVASGRSDYPNQINNVLAFPGVFRGLLDARAKEITLDMLLRAADAIAHVVTDEEINPNFIIPSVFNPAVPKAVAAAIRRHEAWQTRRRDRHSRRLHRPRHRRRRRRPLVVPRPGRARRQHGQPVRLHAAVRRPADAVRRPRGRGLRRARLPVRPVRQPGARARRARSRSSARRRSA